MKELTEKEVEKGVAALDQLRERIIPKHFLLVHVGRIAGIVLCAAWFWRSTAPRPPQLELWQDAI